MHVLLITYLFTFCKCTHKGKVRVTAGYLMFLQINFFLLLQST